MKRPWKFYKYTYKLHYKVEVNMCTGNFIILATPENSVTSLYGSFRAVKLPYKAVTEL